MAAQLHCHRKKEEIFRFENLNFVLANAAVGVFNFEAFLVLYLLDRLPHRFMLVFSLRQPIKRKAPPLRLRRGGAKVRCSGGQRLRIASIGRLDAIFFTGKKLAINATSRLTANSSRHWRTPKFSTVTRIP